MIERISLSPVTVVGFAGSVEAIRSAEMVIIGPGSLYTSILPNLLVREIAEALRGTAALKVYVCNIATQPGETIGYTVADHVEAIERVLGVGVLTAVVANSNFQTQNAGENTVYVRAVPDDHSLRQRCTVISTDLVEFERPWRHDSQKLADVLLGLHEARRAPVAPAAEPAVFLQ